jgi:hypothetical protein
METVEKNKYEYRILQSFKYDNEEKYVREVSYWKRGRCVCTSKNAMLIFQSNPTEADIIAKLNTI